MFSNGDVIYYDKVTGKDVLIALRAGEEVNKLRVYGVVESVTSTSYKVRWVDGGVTFHGISEKMFKLSKQHTRNKIIKDLLDEH